MTGIGMAYLGLGIGLGLLVIGAAYGIGKLAAAAMEGIARQPEAAGNIRITAIILAALIEGFTFLAIIFVNGMGSQVAGTAAGKGFVGPEPKETVIVAPHEEKAAEKK